MIFKTVLEAFVGHFSTAVNQTIVPLVEATVNVFKGVAE
jgi:hypothetical protein